VPGYDEKNKRPRKDIGVEEVRAAGGTLRLTPAEGGWRVVIVDSADLLNKSSANALLKILEEPPARALLLLVSHAPGRLAATIRSRCRRVPLRPLPDAAVAALLSRYRPDLGEDDSALLVRLGDGSIGRAIELAGEGGAGLYGRVLALLLALPRPDVAELHAMGESFDTRRAGGDASFRAASGFLTWWLAGLVRAGATGVIPPGLPAAEVECLSRLLSSRGLDHWLRLWEKIGRLFVRCQSVNLDRKQVWVSAFLDLAAHAR
jgi:DNA polymerase-3 subunit delta'